MRTDIPLEQLGVLPFRLWNQRWFLLAAGVYSPRETGGFNVMTVSWGSLGVIWGKPFALVVVRPGRHTRGFMEKSESFTLSVLPERLRGVLDFCGSRSGRDEDKVKATGLTPLASRRVPAPSFEEAELILPMNRIDRMAG
jgi:flavin reductase (DIM6/NTAB) family NADH-FMN oxidoreductase RutF